jgi:MFS transporter, DHA1 family, multidrug resistance protein
LSALPDMGSVKRAGPAQGEFIILIGLMISLVAMSIDAMLPALPLIAGDPGVSRINDSQFVI